MDIKRGILSTLNDPDLVVKFQQICGIEVVNEDNQDTNKSTVTEQGDRVDQSNGLVNRTTALKSTHSSPVGDRINSSTATTNIFSKQQQHVHHDGKTYYVVHSRLLYYAFHFGAALGNEIFYMTFFPFWFWNIDGYVGRRICLFWCIFMYAGQALKDVLRLPRPSAPPVVRIERLYELEYGMPSTHAMVGAGMPFSIYFLTVERYTYDSQWMLLGAFMWCTLVCCSRLYLGMHSVLDILAGLFFVFLLMIVCFPLLDTIDDFILHSSYSPLVCIIVPVFLCIMYPTPDRWSTARGDTTLIMAVGSGIAIGHWISYTLGVMSRAPTSPPYNIIEPTWTWALLVVIRMSIGVLFVVCLRAGLKSLVTRLVRCVVGLTTEHESSECESSDRRPCVELPIKFLTYSMLSALSLHVVPQIFKRLGIERETFFTEI